MVDGGVAFLFRNGGDGFESHDGPADVMTLGIAPPDTDGPNANGDNVTLTPPGAAPVACKVSLFDDPTKLRLRDVATGDVADYVAIGEGLR